LIRISDWVETLLFADQPSCPANNTPPETLYSSLMDYSRCLGSYKD
jgi:hypothetical protein